MELLRTVPGFSAAPLTAVALISEIGVDMSVFPSAKHLASWAGCCPRNDQSNNKVKSTRISRAGSYLKPLLVQIANAVIKSDKYPECKERYRRIKARRGHKKAIIAICRMLLTAIWNVLSKLEPYSAKGYLEDKLTEHSVVISKSQGLELLRKRGYIFKDEVSADSGWLRFQYCFCRRPCGCVAAPFFAIPAILMLFQTLPPVIITKRPQSINSPI